MNIKEIAEKFVELCRVGKNMEFKMMFYSNEVTSVEGRSEKITGLQAVLDRGLKWREIVSSVHGVEISDPIIARDHFAVSMVWDISYKDGTRSDLDEICVYGVKEGKIISEHFFFENDKITGTNKQS